MSGRKDAEPAVAGRADTGQTGAGQSDGGRRTGRGARGGARPAPIGAEPAWATEALVPLLRAAPGASGVAVAARRGTDRVFLADGRTAWGEGRPVDADTRFEVGSLTKTFTALLLAESVARGEVRYEDPITRFLPRVAAPRVPGGPITLLHLATHTSGLPRLPPGFLTRAAPEWFTNPYATFRTEDLLAALGHTRTRTRPGHRFRYSNFGVGLLGHLLARAASPGRGAYGDYGELLAARVLRPLGLRRTTCTPELPQATGYWHGRARPPWEIPGLPGAGAVRSSTRDLLDLLDALADPSTAPGTAPARLTEALADVTRPRLVVPRGTARLALVWNIRPRPGFDLYHHSGGTRGFTAFAGFSPQAGVSLVALANRAPAPNGAFIQQAYSALRGLATGCVEGA
nr:serine hydrolase domain-containing protein [Streptomyces buecherae]